MMVRTACTAAHRCMCAATRGVAQQTTAPRAPHRQRHWPISHPSRARAIPTPVPMCRAPPLLHSLGPHRRIDALAACLPCRSTRHRACASRRGAAPLAGGINRHEVGRVWIGACHFQRLDSALRARLRIIEDMRSIAPARKSAASLHVRCNQHRSRLGG